MNSTVSVILATLYHFIICLGVVVAVVMTSLPWAQPDGVVRYSIAKQKLWVLGDCYTIDICISS